MKTEFLPHNTHLENRLDFVNLDPHLKKLKKVAYRFAAPLLEKLPRNIPGVYTLTGGRQIGKTTLLKQWMAQLLATDLPAEAIAFLSGELIADAQNLFDLLQQQLQEMPRDCLRYIIIDEITYIHDWDKIIKYLADAGLLDEVILMLSGSDLVLLKAARIRFPGRRGVANEVDFHLYPLSFYETVKMKQSIPADDLAALRGNATAGVSDAVGKTIFTEFNNYLQHGGYLTAINDLAAHNTIHPATLRIYSDWVRGDMLKRDKQELYLKEILFAIIKRYGSQLTWHNLAKDLSIDHHKTVADYIELLNSMDVVFVQSALVEDKLSAAPKKARKVIFCDPFIFHALRSWLSPVADPYLQQINTACNDAVLASRLVEACVTNHCARLYPTYYIKAEGEVDIAYVKDERFWPIEIKWTEQLRSSDLKQIKKYPNALILSKLMSAGTIDGVPVEPLPFWLLRL